MKKLIIIHFLPIENYPPVMNFIRCTQRKITCLTTKNTDYEDFELADTTIHRFISLGGNRLFRLLKYFYFFLSAFAHLVRHRPENVLYYETMSALPALIYKSIFTKRVRIFAHYHEYTSPEEYQQGMAIVRQIHAIEKRFYPKMTWISHTNEQRKNMFCTDHSLPLDAVQVMPNYPDENWGILNKKWNGSEPLKLIYVGYSVDSESSYIQELITWLSSNTHAIQLDIYCINTDQISSVLNDPSGTLTVTVHAPIGYFDLPQILSKYHVGLILYKAQTLNYIYNAPNKLFEYIACGLDVWYPKEMKTTKEYVSMENPRVVEMDFNNLVSMDLPKITTYQESVVNAQKPTYTAEFVYKKLHQELMEEL